jgi:hypothetical protein
MIAEYLLPKLQQRFPNRGLKAGVPPEPCAAFPAAHPEVGNIEICDDGDELTVYVGELSHGHFSNYDDNLTADQKAEIIAEKVAEFLEDLFADRIVIWRSFGGSGGWYHVGHAGLAKIIPKTKFVWSGPMP